MKNKFFKNIARVFTIVAGCLMLASFSPSLDGRAIVVDEGVFPSGLFAKTVGYLPGDIISVTNITGDATIDILVIGALDPSEGVAIMLSPEAATAIGMDRDANNIVKITKRSNQDERVYGTAIIARQDGNATYPAVIENKDEAPAKEESFAYVEPEEKSEFSVGNQEDKIAEEEIEEDEDSTGVIVEETNYGEEYVPDEEWEEDSEWEAADSNDYDEVYDYETDEDDIEETEELPVEDEIASEAYEEEYLPEEDVDEEEYTEDDYIEEEPETEESEEIEEAVPVEDEIAADEDEIIDEEYVEEDVPADEEFVEEDLDAEESEDGVIEEVAEDEYVEDEIAEDEIAEEFVEDEVAEEEPVEEIIEETEIQDPVEEEFEEEIEEEVPVEEPEEEVLEEDTEEYDAIVLVPAEENVPEIEEEEEIPVVEETEEEVEVVEEVEEVEVVEEIEETVEEEILEDVQLIVEEKIESKVSTVEAVTTVTNTSYSKYVVPSMSDLKKGSYYIQISVLKNDDNILEITNKYGKKYPLTIVPNSDGSKKVMVGPLSVDEYGTVLERFKSYGYKDAFIRKIN